jgi:CRP-like cAMP-binding protein
MVAVPSSIAPTASALTFAPGALLLRRGEPVDHLMHVLQGRVVIGILSQGQMVHQLAVVDGPFWLEASAGLLGQAHVVDAMAESTVHVQHVLLQDFMAEVRALPATAHTLLMDMARAQRQQTEVAVSRLAKDADARCAEWLLRHAQPAREKGCLAVTLHERKRTIAAQLGIAPETFSRVLRHLRERELIVGAGRVLDLPNPQALRELAGV